MYLLLLCIPLFAFLLFPFTRVRFIKVSDMSDEQRQRLMKPTHYFLLKASEAITKYTQEYRQLVEFFQQNKNLEKYNFLEILELSTIIGATTMCIDNMTQAVSYYHKHQRKLEYFLKKEPFNNVVQKILNPSEAYFALGLLQKIKENVENGTQYLLSDEEFDSFKEKMNESIKEFS